MKKRTANYFAEMCYRRFLTKGKDEYSTEAFTAVYYPETHSVVVTWYDERIDDNRQHICQVRKSWAQF